jgi:hypothetical protein
MFPVQGQLPLVTVIVPVELCLRFYTMQVIVTDLSAGAKSKVLFQNSITETFQLIKQTYGDSAVSRTRVFEWYARYRDSHANLEDSVDD